ncbi:oxidoreductase FAD/NAD(P)-binding domain protein [Flammeovirgaceae bacterium 311]|nr:oxidoreductase FAD/NAD(P)-binding domain protein [Flammeovirgaceae bacterium 311]
MRYTYRRGFFWLSIFILIALVPLGLALIGEIPLYRSFWIEFGVAMGFIALSLFGLQFLFSGRFNWVAPTYGMDNIIQYHRELGIIAFLFLLAHPFTLILKNQAYLAYFDPRVNLMRAIALNYVSLGVIAIIATSIWRTSFKLNYEKWRLLHGFLALSIIFVGVVHSIQVGHYLDPLWKKIALAAFMALFAYLTIHTRIVRPWLNKKYPYKVVEVKEEIGDCHSLTLAPNGHKKLEYIPGQFAWISICDTPFTLQQHPFSFASSARDNTITFTAKAMGDFTGSWKKIKKGRKAFLEGPFGSFTPEEDSHLFLLMGGIGVTPCMSMLRTMRDDKDPRKAILIYANKDWDDITFREELDELCGQINLTVIHVLEKTPKDWKGEEGFVDQDMLKKYLPDKPNEWMYFLCGPMPMMDIGEESLRNLGVDWHRIYSERFEIV